MKLNFEELVEALKRDGYIVDTSINGQYVLKGKGVRVGLNKEDTYYPQLSNRIAADNDRCFDKWSKCPLVMKLPVDYETLTKALTHLGSNEGYEISNSYSYLDDNPYPYEC